MNTKNYLGRFLSFTLLLAPFSAMSEEKDDVSTVDLEEIEIKAYSGNEKKEKVNNIEVIGSDQLIRAACCNLGESFTTNPSVDATYSDAATG
ncbi:MAG: TonB-dependent receptor, partial [Paludibacteraceae bacterium]|nr:TonB-dependent receptor [Paludibacteraceae bacterium]